MKNYLRCTVLLFEGEAPIPKGIPLRRGSFGEYADVIFRPIGYADMPLDENEDYAIIPLNDDVSTEDELVANVKNQFGEYLPSDFDYNAYIGEIDGVVDIDATIITKCADCGAEYTNIDSIWDEEEGWVFCPHCNCDEFWTVSVLEQ